ncbi:hypothetical protein ACIB24_18520 [Spongisporangium articulatum]|uniref:Uncharacterized protein n=1 Tax=Spongisporangium articulatum TaxID=3362603 RepID=A0ABW8ARP3_9ACTN
MTYTPGTDDLYGRLLPFVKHTDDDPRSWAERWTVVLEEVQRRSERMGLDFAISSVWDDLMAERL